MASDTTLEFESVNGFFLQDDPATELGTFDMMRQNFGLIDQIYDTDTKLPNNGKDLSQWQRFAHKLQTLNTQAPENEWYRLLYLGRHGQGYHNIGESFYGTNAWDCYYALLDADPKAPEIVFDDAHLTKLGIQQAQAISKFWAKLIETQSMPTPQIYYVSPLTRAIQTANHTFEPLYAAGGLLNPASPSNPNSSDAPAPYKPIVKELLREGHGIHTCDRRPSKSYLISTFPNLTFLSQDPFPEQDPYYSSTLREPPEAHSNRMLALLRDILSPHPHPAKTHTYLSLTSHSGSIAALLRAVGHRSFALPTGGAIPLLLKVKRIPGPAPAFDPSDKTGWEGKPECHGDPLTAGKKGYKDIGEYAREIERGVGH